MKLAGHKKTLAILALTALMVAANGQAEDKAAVRAPQFQYPVAPWGYGPPPGYGYGYGAPWGYAPPAYGYGYGYPAPMPFYGRGPWGYGPPQAWGGQASQQPRINAAVLNELKGKLGVRPNQESYWNDLTKELLKLKPQENPLKSQPVLAAYEKLRSVLDEKQRTLADGFKNSLIW